MHRTSLRPTSAAIHASSRPHPRVNEIAMWNVLTSTGQRVTGIAHESDARRSIQSMGHTEPLSIYAYRVTPNRGTAFVAELRRCR